MTGDPMSNGPRAQANLAALDRASKVSGQARKTGSGLSQLPVSSRTSSDWRFDRIAIEAVSPAIDGGQFAVKRVVGDRLDVEADVFSDGHDILAAVVMFKRASDEAWCAAPMAFVENDRWRGSFLLLETGYYQYSIAAWRDLFGSWRADVIKKRNAGQAIDLELAEGVEIVRRSIDEARARADVAEVDLVAIGAFHEALMRHESTAERAKLLLDQETAALMSRAGARGNPTVQDRVLRVWVDRPAAAFSAWYEMFPRSQAGDARRHGTFDDVIARLPYVRDLGFDVLYFTPIHPIGEVNRKGRNNSLVAGPGDPGSPYAIGSAAGGHDAIHAELGTFADFRRLVAAACDHGLEIALDFAIQCAPDHPWIREHPEWFDWRPDGTIKFAENPPKKYEDIVNLHFYREAFPGVWEALRDVVMKWVDEGVFIFRVDNPHTKPYPFWEWLIGEIHETHPDVIFLSEAFTRPKVMKRLAKLGFSQSYTYFTWRNTKAELTEYLTALTRTDAIEYFRPNFFANTPDINPFPLQQSGRAGFRTRLVLAATLAGNYGIYSGFELCEAASIAGKEEYRDSEKYEIRAWDWDREGHIKDDVRLVNRLRRDNPALQQLQNVRFYNCWNDQILYYGKFTTDLRNFILVAVNLDPRHGQGANFEVPLWEFGLPDDATIGVEDLVSGGRFSWAGKVQHIWLDPVDTCYRIWRLIPPGEVQA